MRTFDRAFRCPSIVIQSGLADLLGVPAARVNQQRLYRALDALLPHKEALEAFLKNRLGELLDLEYDMLLYDVTSTYFEGERCRIARFGYNRDGKKGVLQVNIGLMADVDGRPVGAEVFEGNVKDSETVEGRIQELRERHGFEEMIFVAEHFPHHPHSLVQGKHGGLARIRRHRHYHVGKDVGRTANQVLVAVGDGIERPGIKGGAVGHLSSAASAGLLSGADTRW